MSYSRLEGTTQDEFTFGKGDLDAAGQPIAGVRTTSLGILQYKNSGGEWIDVPDRVHELTPLDVYINGDSGNNATDGLSGGSAWQNFDNISQKRGIFSRPIHREIRVNVSGTIRQTAATTALVLDGLEGAGRLTFTGTESVVSSHTLTGYQNDFAVADGRTYIDVAAAGWTVDAHRTRWVKMLTGYTGNQYIPIGSNTATRLHVWHPSTTFSAGATFQIVEFTKILSELIPDPGVVVDCGDRFSIQNTLIPVSFERFDLSQDMGDGGWGNSTFEVLDMAGYLNFTRCSVIGFSVFQSWVYFETVSVFGEDRYSSFSHAFVDFRRVFFTGTSSLTSYGVGGDTNILYFFDCRFRYSDYKITANDDSAVYLYGKMLFEAGAEPAISAAEARVFFAAWPYQDVFKFVDCNALTIYNGSVKASTDIDYLIEGTGGEVKIGALTYPVTDFALGAIPSSLSMGVTVIPALAGTPIDQKDQFVDGPGVPTVDDSVAVFDGITGRLIRAGASTLAQLAAMNTVALEPTGFSAPENVIVTYNAGARTVTLTGTVNAYWRGEAISVLTTGWTSSAHAAAPTQGLFLYYDGSSFVWSTSVWPFTSVQIAYVAFSSAGAFLFCAREVHGVMAWQTHEELHEKIGTWRKSGGDVTGFVFSSVTPVDRRPVIAECEIRDEDLPTTLLAHSTQNNYSTLHLDGASGVPVITTGLADIPWLVTGSAQWNEFTGGAWTSTQLNNNEHMSLWLVGIPVTSDAGSQSARYVWMTGQSVGSLGQQQSQSPNNLSFGEFSVVAPEFIFMEQVIIQEAGVNNWHVVEQRKLDGSRSQYVSGTSGGVTDHGALTGLTGYDHPQYSKRPERTVTVSKTGALTAGDFDTIQGAIDSITVADQDDYWVVLVHPGIYAENVVMKDNVDLQGFGGQLATIEGSISWPSTTCTDGWWSNTDNITVQNTALAQSASVVSVEAGWHYMTNCYILANLDGTSGNLIHQTGGTLDLLITALEYEHTGADVAGTDLHHHCVEHHGGDFDSFQSEFYMAIADTIQNASFYHGYSATVGSRCRLAYAPFYLETPAGYAGNAIAFMVDDGSIPLLVQNNDIQIAGTGGTGTGYTHWVDSNATLVSTGNTISIDGFEFNYKAYCEDITSHLEIKFNNGYAVDGFTGLGAAYVQYILSGALGELDLSGNITMKASATVDGRDVSADGAALDNQVSHAFVDNLGNQFSALTEKVTPVDDDLIVIEDSENSFVKRKVKKSVFAGLPQHAIDSTTAHSAPTDNTNFNASASAHGFLKKLDSNPIHFLNGEGNWVTVPAAYRYHEYDCHMTGIASNTYGLFSKGPPTTANPSGIPTTTPYDVFSNGAMAPWLITTAQDVNTLDLMVSAAAVSQATVGTTPTVRIDVYNNLGGSGAPQRTLLGTYRLPVVSGEASLGVYNNLSGTALIRFRLVLGTALALTEGMLIGLEFVNETTDNTTINAIKSAVLVASAVSISETPTGYQLTISPTAPSAPNTGDVWVDNS